MATMDSLRTRVRDALGDPPVPFRDTLRGTGSVSQYELSANNVTAVVVIHIAGSVTTTLATPADYTLDAADGLLDLTVPLPLDNLLLVSGSSTSLFTDAELDTHITDALMHHTQGRTDATRYLSPHGFIRYDEVAIGLGNLPPEEESLVALLAQIEASWVLYADAATDINVETSDGTTVNRAQRFAQLQALIPFLTSQYEMLCSKLGVGLFAIEVTNLRRVSRTTNRLVPEFREREYDDYSLPKRILPPIGPSHKYDDESGIPSQSTYGYR